MVEGEILQVFPLHQFQIFVEMKVHPYLHLLNYLENFLSVSSTISVFDRMCSQCV